MRKSDSEPPERAREPLAYPTPRNGDSEPPDAEPTAPRRHPLEGFRYALEGIIAVVRTQRHMRFHFFSVVLVLLMGLLFRLDKREMLVLLFTISIVLIAEMFNSAIEATVDLVTEEYHPKAKFAKDIAAGAVLVATLNAVVVAWVLFMGDLRLEQIRLRMERAEPTLAVAVTIIVVSGDLLASVLALLLAALIAQSRVDADIHSWREVVLGSLLGVGLGALIFWLTPR